jgi:pimeloyl-ACP methyl ester carboxylesterase
VTGPGAGLATKLRDGLRTARAVYGRSHGLGERRVRSNRRAPPPLDYPYHEAGSGPTLVLVHGMVDQQETWRFGLDEWARHFRVVSLDLPGCNHAPRRGEATVEGYADFLHEFTSALGLDRCFFLGLSFGAWVALEYAARHPERAAGVLLASLPFAPGDDTARRMAGFVERNKVRPWLRATVGALKGSRPYLHFLVDSVTHSSTDNFDFNVSLIANGQASSDALTWLDNYQSYLTFDAPARLDELARRGVPYLAVYGEGDRPVASGRYRDVAPLAGHAVVLPGANHCVHIEASDAFNAAAVEFFSRLPP